MEIPATYIRKYWFGTDDQDAIAKIVLLMERDRVEQYKAALDITTNTFNGVFRGITGILGGEKISVIYSIGPAHIADCVSFLKDGFGVRTLISTGSVGGLSTDIGDVVVSNSCTTQDAYSFACFPGKVNREKSLGYTLDIDMENELQVSDTITKKIRELYNCKIQYGKMFTIPAVSLENKKRLQEIQKRNYVALDLESGPFLAACKANNVRGFCIHWVTDLPLTRNFYYKYEGNPEIAKQDWDKKHRQWLNMPRMLLPIVCDLMTKSST
jgi:nucleoside phosphorylase